MEPFCNLIDIESRIDFDMDGQERRVAQAAIEDASDLAREYGRNWSGPTTAPRVVIVLVRRAVVRHIKNINGYTVSRAGDETLQWADDAGEHMADVYFTKDEQQALARAAGPISGGLVSVGVYAHNSRSLPRSPGYVPDPYGKPFPFHTEAGGPW